MQDEKQALHECVRTALAETQNAAVADQSTSAADQNGELDAVVEAQIQQRRKQQVPLLHAMIVWYAWLVTWLHHRISVVSILPN